MKIFIVMLLTLCCQMTLLGQSTRIIEGQVKAGPDQELIPGVSVLIKGTAIGTVSDSEGKFRINVPQEYSQLVISFLGFKTKEIELTGSESFLDISLETLDMDLDEVQVMATGYQEIPRERANGSFVTLDRDLVNRRISTNILDRLEDVTPGLIFNRVGSATEPISIRGRSTINANAQPLIVVDNFPYDGPIENINPNDVESITVLKDASAASIWGARAGNGVIVITTKRAKEGQNLRVSFNANTTVTELPDLYYDPKMSIASFIDLERELFDRGLFNSSINSNNKPRVSPSVEALLKARNGQITRAEAESLLEQYKQQDVRRDLLNYYYRPAVNQQYSLSLSGSSPNHRHNLAIGYDRNQSQVVGNGNSRFSLTKNDDWNLLNGKLELGTGIYWVQGNSSSSTELPPSFIYDQLAGPNGEPLTITRTYSERYISSISNQRPELLDWTFVPLNEIGMLDDRSKSSDLRLNANLGYRIIPSLKAEVKYQYWTNNSQTKNHSPKESFFVRDLINQFSEFDAEGNITRHIPIGGILDLQNGRGESHSLRGMLSYNESIGKGTLNAIAGFEGKMLSSTSDGMRYFGYDDELGISVPVDPLTRFRRLHNNSLGSIPASQTHSGIADRFISYFINASYQLDTRFNFSASARKDQSNLFGVNANQRGVPLWSIGGGYTLSEEKWYKFEAIPYLRVRLTYGYNGNVDKSTSAFTTARYFVSASSIIPNLPSAAIINPPNPNLSWEKIQITNLALDFGSKNSRVSGSLEFYQKNGEDLIGDIEVPSSTGVYNFRGNFANTSTFGYDFNLSTQNIDRGFPWKTDFFWSYVREKVTRYDFTTAPSNYINSGGVFPFVGRPLFGVYGYEWAGLNPENGNPLGIIDGQPSEDYREILNSATPESLQYAGPGRPVHFGSIRNTFSWKGLELSANISFRMGYFYRRTSVNYNSIYQGAFDHADYDQRWREPGDELITQVPSMPSAQNAFRNTFYLGSAGLIGRGDHIRLQDIRLAYSFSGLNGLPQSLRNIQAYVYANNIGLLWKATEDAFDPDFRTSRPLRSIAMGINWNF
ncbi:SusC/RagA family TonB-linked outer membrane protein [Algoriphagus litoralis]|uniref:SusC/RagA family TonB-linked outer membrane protein n=1 Tax=Algoriphagus litoralis TaxID=2202829 RepID=UPI000DB904D4|nr:SusC/RagA family TonB-linked outer membrane protein [Algoriphagus litoralis]